ncbi:MAG: RNA pseudouridine synthase [Myxococcales bacterium]|nr:RNA pseudouridine synthase [Myxococcales bacterium]
MNRASAPQPQPVVLFSDPDWVAVQKPALAVTLGPAPRGCISLGDVVSVNIGRPKVLHPLSRLDVGVTGVVLFARSPRALAAADAARREGRYRRVYEALCYPAPAPREGAWRGPIGLDPRDPRRRAVSAAGEPAESLYECVEARAGIAWLRLTPRTGRTHQLRVHAAHAGCPVVGDPVYGTARRVSLAGGDVVTASRPLLHLARVVVPGTERVVEAPWADDMAALWESLAGR